jgi:4'-phosphopantetheinyl transferase
MVATGFDVWLIEPGSPPDLAILSVDERAWASRFARTQDRDSFLSTRLALRCLLADAMAAHPRELCFARNAWGKPELDRTVHSDRFEFNVSRTEGLAAIGLSRDARIGVDIERQRPVPDCRRIAADVFGADVAERLAGFPQWDREDIFLRLWTAGEALVKAAGTGLGGFGTPVPVTLSCAAEICLNSGHGVEGIGAWSLVPLDLPAGFIGSIAIERSSLPDRAAWVPKRIELAQLLSPYMH